MAHAGVPVERVDVAAYTVPTEGPESDGTLAWTDTTIVIVEASGVGTHGLGYSYADEATARLAATRLAGIVTGHDAMAVPGAWTAMVRATRNLGRPGIVSMAIAAVDPALWDLKARLLDIPLATLVGATRDAAPVYGSGGFTSYSVGRLQAQLAGWVEAGIPRVKMKDPGCAVARLRHLEYFHDHARIERLFFDGAGAPVDGLLRPDLSRPGLGLELRRADVERYAVR